MIRTLLLSLLLLTLPTLGAAQVTLNEETGTGETVPQKTESGVTIEINQESPRGTYGTWTLILPGGNDQRADSLVSQTFYHLPEGLYTIIADSPQGASVKIHLEKENDLPEIVDRRQATFRIVHGEYIRVLIEYTFTRTGLVIIRSDPAGLTYEMQGPDDAYYTGTTPQSYQDTPEGQYTVQFNNIEGCRVPARKSLLLTKDGRISFSVHIACEKAEHIREEQKKEQSGGEQFVTVTIDDGIKVVFRDVPQIAWFAIHVFNAARLGIISGYRDSTGNLTGTYGPGNPVSVAELAKVAHKVASLTEMNRRPENIKARGQWFSGYIASAEKLGWTIYNDATIDLARPATRGEVLMTLLQALDIPLQWQKGNVFTDVTPRTAFAAAIETAAGDGVVSGHTDKFGSTLGTFGSEDPVNRAEMAKILDRVIEVYKKGEDSLE